MTSVRIPAAVLEQARSVARDVAGRAGIALDAGELLGGRAVLLGLQAADRISAGGATRLLDARDGWCALTLARSDDVAAVPALAQADTVGDDPWPVVARCVHELGVEGFAERARMLGLPVGVLGETPSAAAVHRRIGPAARAPAMSGLLVADLSAMWAGPLCGRLLGQAGATVVKVESATRPDGTRQGPQAFFDWVNTGKLSYRADFAQPGGLHRLLSAADVVIESSRPAALQRRGLGPQQVPGRPGRTWLRITGHGTEDGRADWVAFGDDAAVSGGLVSGTAEAPRFCGDAIADPLTGLHAALAVLQSQARGGGELVELSMSAVAANYAALPRGDEILCTATPPGASSGPAPGADNEVVDRLVGNRLATTC
ncbi:CoA transferase [Mycobacterium sp. ITM-2016-00317]|uniref:CoA transferase n=1 Tax=Mycobacterium sp. ITM-2016-00317 TaxID=2099694 RepID=UPI00287FCEB4|nr:CoA transferase [Mycobacterium sp. ITM-2016-00317]WNG87966.1 CoA transferase [Mycobacterium sp. ITM-2016-00317]